MEWSSGWLSVFEDSTDMLMCPGPIGALHLPLPLFLPPSDVPQPVLAFSLPFQIRLPDFLERHGDRVWLPEYLGLGNLDLCPVYLNPGCLFAAVWVDTDIIWNLPKGQRSQRFL